MLTSKSSCTCLCTQNIKDKFYIKDGLLGVHTVQYVEFVLSFKRMYYLHLQSDWTWCKRKLRWLEGGNMSIIQEGLNKFGQTYRSLTKCVNCPNIRFINKIWHGILPQKPIGIQVNVNFPCYFVNTVPSFPITGSHLSQFTYTPNILLMCLLNGCTILLSKLFDLTTQHNWTKYRVNTFKFSFFAHNTIPSFALVRFQKHFHTNGNLHCLFIFVCSFV